MPAGPSRPAAGRWPSRPIPEPQFSIYNITVEANDGPVTRSSPSPLLLHLSPQLLSNKTITIGCLSTRNGREFWRFAQSEEEEKYFHSWHMHIHTITEVEYSKPIPSYEATPYKCVWSRMDH
jgi:hypothetical protein